MSYVHRLLKEWEKDQKNLRSKTKSLKKKPKKKKQKKKCWDATTNDLTQYKLSEEEQLNKKARIRSKHQDQANKLVRQAKKKRLAKKRESKKKKKESMISKWDGRVGKPKVSKKTKDAESAEEKENRSSQEEEQKKESTGIFNRPKNISQEDVCYEWGTGKNASLEFRKEGGSDYSVPIDTLDAHLCTLQLDFKNFQEKMKKELEAPVHLDDDVKADESAKVLELSDKVDSMFLQLKNLTATVSAMQTQLTRIEFAQNDVYVKAAMPKMNEHSNNKLTTFPTVTNSSPNIKSTNINNENSDFIKITEPDVSAESNLLNRTFIPSYPLSTSIPATFNSPMNLQTIDFPSPKFSNFQGRKFEEQPIVITSTSIPNFDFQPKL